MRKTHANRHVRWRLVAAAAPAVMALLIGTLLLVVMMSNAARLSPAVLEQRAARNLDRGATADVAMDYRRLLQRSPADQRYRDALHALEAHTGSVAP